ncbi:hypothetical protein OIV83_000146 [Microbotryomycetes sp. JL201]|nr:hypothetical protein OIV83_000146 [Microbotryomycetes sp. JL201]
MLDYMSYSMIAPAELTDQLWLRHDSAATTQPRSQSSASSSASSTSSASSHEAQTPPQSPSLAAHAVLGDEPAHSQSMLLGIDTYQHNSFKRKLPPMPPAKTQLSLQSVPPTSKSLPLPKVVATSATPAPQSASSSSAPVQQSREWEEARRGRSRWPRLLWRSDVDDEALDILEAYHKRAVGGPLPLLKPRSAPRAVKKWSDSMERAGL